MKTLKETTSNLIRRRLENWYKAANIDQLARGMEWYSDAQRYCTWLAQRYCLDPYTTACVISALSPHNKWERNKTDAANLIECWINGGSPEDVKVCTFNRNKQRAFDILNDGLGISKISPKTHAFAMNVGLLSEKHVTIDRWHLRACMHSVNAEIDLSANYSLTPKQYQRIEQLTASLADKYGVTAYQFQAVVWVVIRESVS